MLLGSGDCEMFELTKKLKTWYIKPNKMRLWALRKQLRRLDYSPSINLSYQFYYK
jgi:hypothetical protein